MSTLASTARPLGPEEVELRLNTLRAIRVLVSCRGRDALSDNVDDFGIRLAAALEAKDWATSREVIAEIHAWLKTMSGVVTARLTSFFDKLATVES